MTLVTLPDGQTVDLDSIEHCVSSSSSNEIRRTEVFPDAAVENLSHLQAIHKRIHVYDFYRIPDDEDSPPPYSLQNELDLPSDDMGLHSDPTMDKEPPSYDVALSSDPTRGQNWTSMNGDSLAVNNDPHTGIEREMHVQDDGSLQKTGDALHPAERRMAWTVQARPNHFPSGLSPTMSHKEEQSSSFQSLHVEQYLPNLKRKYPGRNGSTCIECWLIHKKCSGDLPCNRCRSRDISIAVGGQPCIDSSLDALSPDLIDLQIGMQALEGTMVEVKNKMTSPMLIPFLEAFQRPSVYLRLWMHWLHVFILLNRYLQKKCRVDFSIGHFINSLFCNLRNVNLLISILVEGHGKDTGNMNSDLVLFFFALLQTRAAMCQRLLYSLQSEIRKNLRPKSQKHSTFFVFLMLVFEEVRQFVCFDEKDFLEYRSDKQISILLRSTKVRDTIVDHLLRWLLYHSTCSAERNGVDKDQRLRRIFKENPPLQNISVYTAKHLADGLFQTDDLWFFDDPSRPSNADRQFTDVSIIDGRFANTSAVPDTEDVSEFCTISDLFDHGIGEVGLDLSLLYFHNGMIIDMESRQIYGKPEDASKVEDVNRNLERFVKVVAANDCCLEFPTFFMSYPGWKD